MKRIAAIAVTLLALGAGGARAQVAFKLHPGQDSAVGLVPGQTVNIPVLAVTAGLNVLRAKLTFHYDPAKITILSVFAPCCSGLWNTVDTSRTATSFTVGASGFISSSTGDAPVFSLRVRLNAGVTDGTFMRIEADSMLLQFLSGSQVDRASTHIGQVCHATQQWGDVDTDGQVDSRDALITLSEAIGLPAAGFNLTLGDVDQDGTNSSRDALFMLSYAVGVGIFQPHRTGVGVPDVCPTTGTTSEPLVYVRRGSSADSLFTLPGGSTTPAFIPGTEDASNEVIHPRLASDGVSVIYDCYPAATGSQQRLCRVNTDGTGLTDVSVQASERADWIPGDSVLAYIANAFQLFRMSPTGAGNVMIGNPSFTVRGSVAWNRTGSAVAYTSFSGGIRLVAADGSSDVPMGVGGITDPYIVRWNAAGDSLAFNRSNTQGIWTVPAAGGIPARLTSIMVPAFEEFDWTSEGLIFRSAQPGLRGLFLLPSGGGTLVRLTRNDDVMPASRRNP